MTLEELVGQQLVVGISGPSLTDEWRAHLCAIRAGGFIPFARNFESPDQLRRLITDLRAALGKDLLVMVDHEGGTVVRFSSGVTPFPDAWSMGQRRDRDTVFRQGEIEAVELKALGIDVNLAPCVDVLVEGSDPVIGRRSYGSDPGLVAVMARARIRGLQSQGLSACAKHFPGLGAVPKDPHKQLPTLDLDWPAMRERHLIPFVASIQAGVDAVMSSHVCYPTLDDVPGVPATFSARLIRELLRGELGFHGVTVTDDLEMGALRALCGIGEAAVRAVAAGHDIVLVCADRQAQRETFRALCGAYQSSRLSVQELHRSVGRINALRQRHFSSCS